MMHAGEVPGPHITDSSRKIVYASRQAESLTGSTRRQL